MVSNITNKLQKYIFFSHTIAYEYAIFLTWKSVSMESFYLNISFYFFPFQIKYSFYRLEYKEDPYPTQQDGCPVSSTAFMFLPHELLPFSSQDTVF